MITGLRIILVTHYRIFEMGPISNRPDVPLVRTQTSTFSETVPIFWNKFSSKLSEMIVAPKLVVSV